MLRGAIFVRNIIKEWDDGYLPISFKYIFFYNSTFSSIKGGTYKVTLIALE